MILFLRRLNSKGKSFKSLKDGETQIILAVNNDYNAIIFAQFDSSIISSRVLEDDKITIFGK